MIRQQAAEAAVAMGPDAKGLGHRADTGSRSGSLQSAEAAAQQSVTCRLQRTSCLLLRGWQSNPLFSNLISISIQMLNFF